MLPWRKRNRRFFFQDDTLCTHQVKESPHSSSTSRHLQRVYILAHPQNETRNCVPLRIVYLTTELTLSRVTNTSAVTDGDAGKIQKNHSSADTSFRRSTVSRGINNTTKGNRESER